jgi:hypothetical protein
MIKSIFIILTLSFLATAQSDFRKDSCTTQTLNLLGSYLLREDQDTINLWRINNNKDNLLCAALKGYQERQKLRRKMLIGTLSISGPCLLFTLIGSFSDGGYSPIPEKLIEGSAIIAAVNAAIWMGFYIKFRIERTDPEKTLINDYKEYQNKTQSNLKNSSQSLLNLAIEF